MLFHLKFSNRKQRRRHQLTNLFLHGFVACQFYCATGIGLCCDIFNAKYPFRREHAIVVTNQPLNTSKFEKSENYFIVDTETKRRWEIPLHSIFALGFSVLDIRKEAFSIIQNSTLEFNRVGALTHRSWYSLRALKNLLPGVEFNNLAPKRESFVTLIDIQVDLLSILNNSLTFMKRFAPRIYNSVLLVSYDQSSCSIHVNISSQSSALPCFFSSSWIESLQLVNKNLKCNKNCQSGHDMNLIMLGRLVTTFSLLCAGIDVFLTDTDVILFEDPINSVSGNVDMMFTAERRKIKKFYSSTPPGRWYIRPLLHNVVDEKYASFALNNGVIYYRTSDRLIKWYLYFSEFVIMNLDDGFLQTNFVEFFKQHRPTLFHIRDLLNTTHGAKIVPATSLKSIESIIREKMPVNSTVSVFRNIVPVRAVANVTRMKDCIGCSFGVSWISPKSLLPETNNFWNVSKRVWERSAEFMLTGTHLAIDDTVRIVDDTKGFPLLIGMFSNYRWLAHCMQLQERFPNELQQAFVNSLWCDVNEKISSKPVLLTAYHANCKIWPGEKKKVIDQMGLWYSKRKCIMTVNRSTLNISKILPT